MPPHLVSCHDLSQTDAFKQWLLADTTTHVTWVFNFAIIIAINYRTVCLLWDQIFPLLEESLIESRQTPCLLLDTHDNSDCIRLSLLLNEAFAEEISHLAVVVDWLRLDVILVFDGANENFVGHCVQNFNQLVFLHLNHLACDEQLDLSLHLDIEDHLATRHDQNKDRKYSSW